MKDKKEIGLCRKCGKRFEDIKSYRKYTCGDCWRDTTKKAYRRKASTLEGYFNIMLSDIKNNPQRNRYENNIDMNLLMGIYKSQNGKCAISGIEMTWGYGDAKDNTYKKPFNISIDRLDSSNGYVRGNIALICNIVNMFKGEESVDTVYDMASRIVNHKEKLNEMIKSIKNLI